MKKTNVLDGTDTSRREFLLGRIERTTELPLLVLAFLMIPLLLGPILWDTTPGEESIFQILNNLIWALFAVDLVVKVFIAPKRLQYLRRHWLEVLIVVVPFLRPLRILRIIIFGSRAWVGARRLVHIDFLLVYAIGLVMLAATLAVTFESGDRGNIQTFADALWWAMATITTVGYGDAVPVTMAGRAVGFFLMLGGVAVFSGVTANMASLLLKGQQRSEKPLELLTHQIVALQQEIANLRSSNKPHTTQE